MIVRDKVFDSCQICVDELNEKVWILMLVFYMLDSDVSQCGFLLEQNDMEVIVMFEIIGELVVVMCDNDGDFVDVVVVFGDLQVCFILVVLMVQVCYWLFIDLVG